MKQGNENIIHIKINVKKSTRKQNEIIQKDFDCPEHVATVKELLTVMVTSMLAEYKKRGKRDENFLPVLTNLEIEEKSASGKIGFGLLYGRKTPKPEASIRAALQCFEDGMVALFFDGVQMEHLEDEVKLKEGSELTFVRLVPLAGRMW